ncbi:hypothetical protein Tco_0459067 [Tanacetum coccineum]
MGSLPSKTVAKPKGRLKGAIYTTRMVLSLMTIRSLPPPFIKSRGSDELVEETFTDPEHDDSSARSPSDPIPFLRTARALIDVHGEEMILHDGNESLILNMRNDTSSYSNEPHQESINMIDIYNVSHEEIHEDLFATNHPSGNPTFSSHTDLTSPEVNDDIFDPEEDIIKNLLNLDKTKDLPPYHDNQLSGNPTPEEFKAYLLSDSFLPGNSNHSSLLPPFHNSLSGSTTSSSPSLHISKTSNYFLEMFADELAHITFSSGNDDLPFDAESDLL